MESPAQPTQRDFRYWAFISYQPPDFALAKWLFQSLETYGIPRVLVGQETKHGAVPKRLYPVFLDREELPLGDATGDPIEWALRQSRALIVVCSPQSARSAELERHIRFFQSLGRADRIICLLVDSSRPQGGAPSEQTDQLVPEAAKGAMVVDMRKGGDDRRQALVRIVAHVIGVDFKEFSQRDQQMVQRNMQLIMAGAGVLFVTFAVLLVQLFVERQRADAAVQEAVVQSLKARQEEQKAIKAREAAEKALRDAQKARQQTLPGQ